MAEFFFSVDGFCNANHTSFALTEKNTPQDKLKIRTAAAISENLYITVISNGNETDEKSRIKAV